jgi:hypothetical protein
MEPTKWVVKRDYVDDSSPGKPFKRVTWHVVVGLNNAGYAAKIAVRTTDKLEADRTAKLLNRQTEAKQA